MDVQDDVWRHVGVLDPIVEHLHMHFCECGGGHLGAYGGDRVQIGTRLTKAGYLVAAGPKSLVAGTEDIVDLRGGVAE